MSNKKPEEPLLIALVTMPWQVSVVLAAIVFAAMRWFIPMQLKSNLLLPLGNMISGWAPLALIFLLTGLISFIRDKWGGAPTSVAQDYSECFPPPKIASPAAVPDTHSSPRPAPREIQQDIHKWSIDLLRHLEWKRFESLCAKYFLILGKRVQTVPHGADGGIDARVYKNDSDILEYAIQCKAWNNMVGVQPIRELFGVMAHESAGKGVFITTSRFSEEAKKFATQHADKLFLIDGEKFLSMLLLLPEDKQKALLQQATEGDFTTPSCASCGIKMIRREGKNGNFWGCKNYPKCRSTLKIAAA